MGSLAPLLVELSRDIAAPSGKSLYQEWRASASAARAREKDARPLTDENLVETRIGSGSDFTVFLNHLCRPTVELTFEGPYGVYHSAYDDFYWMNHFGDPGYRYHTLMTQFWGSLALRFTTPMFCPSISQRTDEISTGSRRSCGAGSTCLCSGGTSPGSGRRGLQRGYPARPDAGSGGCSLGCSVSIKPLEQVESNWANPDGLPGRPWFKHTLYAARFTYGHLELPGLTEAIEKRDWKEARRQAAILSDALSRNTALLNAAGDNIASR